MTWQIDHLSAILRAIASLLWPILGFVALMMFRKELRSLIGRISKAKFLGQEVEIREELYALHEAAKATEMEADAIPDNIPAAETNGDGGGSSRDEIPEVERTISDVLRVASDAPKLALVALSGELDRNARKALAVRGLLKGRRSVPLHIALTELAAYGLPPNMLGSLKLFNEVRNKIVHGVGATDADALSAIDSGITLLRVLEAMPNEVNVVHHPGVKIYSDEGCLNQITDAKGLILETTSPGGAKKDFRIFPTTRTDYEKGMVVAWEWNMSRVWGEAWYQDPETHEIKQAWKQAAEFIGRHLEVV